MLCLYQPQISRFWNEDRRKMRGIINRGIEEEKIEE